MTTEQAKPQFDQARIDAAKARIRARKAERDALQGKPGWEAELPPEPEPGQTVTVFLKKSPPDDSD